MTSVIETPWEHEGVTYTKGDPIRISDTPGKFIFEFWSEDKGGVTVTVWEQGRHYRSFYATRVITGNKKEKGVVVCPEHPTYGAKRRPRTGCARCLAGWEAKSGKNLSNLSPHETG